MVNKDFLLVGLFELLQWALQQVINLIINPPQIPWTFHAPPERSLRCSSFLVSLGHHDLGAMQVLHFKWEIFGLFLWDYLVGWLQLLLVFRKSVCVFMTRLFTLSDNSNSKSLPWMFWICLLALHSALPGGSIFPDWGAKPDPFAESVVDRTPYQSKAQNHFVNIDLFETDLYKILRYKFFCWFAGGLCSMWNSGF